MKDFNSPILTPLNTSSNLSTKVSLTDLVKNLYLPWFDKKKYSFFPQYYSGERIGAHLFSFFIKFKFDGRGSEGLEYMSEIGFTVTKTGKYIRISEL